MSTVKNFGLNIDLQEKSRKLFVGTSNRKHEATQAKQAAKDFAAFAAEEKIEKKVKKKKKKKIKKKVKKKTVKVVSKTHNTIYYCEVYLCNWYGPAYKLWVFEEKLHCPCCGGKVHV